MREGEREKQMPLYPQMFVFLFLYNIPYIRLGRQTYPMHSILKVYLNVFLRHDDISVNCIQVKTWCFAF